MSSTEALTEADRTEKTTFSGTIAKVETGKDADGKAITSEMYIVPVQLRPKTDADLATWKEKIAKGVQDGDYTYTFKNGYGIIDSNKGELAAAIVNNAKKGSHGNPKLDAGKTVHAEDVRNVLQTKTYASGETIKFPVYKKVTEMLWLDVTAGGTKEHKKEFLKGEGAYFEIGKNCICEERIRAFLRTLRVGEGTGEIIKAKDKVTKKTIYIPHDFEKGYITGFGGSLITDLSDHPRINYGGSTAAGAYQVMKDTWDDTQYSAKKAQYNIDSFSKENQDKFSVLLMKHHPGCADLLSILLSGQTENSIRGRGSRIWASLPEKGDNSRYLFRGQPQPVTPMVTVLEHYETFLKEELRGNSPLHLQKGFLQLFNIPCNCGSESTDNSEWHHPLTRMELRGWYGSGFYPDSSDHGYASIRNSKTHDGLDLYAPVGTTIYACVDGEIYDDYISTTYGKTLGIKGTYNGSTYYFFYGHLSERNVVKNNLVKAGDPIGKTGQTGNASGQPAKYNHLHFEVRSSASRTTDRLDPLSTITELARDVNRNPEQSIQTGIL